MFRKPLVTICALALAGPALSQEVTSTPAMPSPAEVIMADELEGASIVSLEGNYDQQIWDDSAPLNAMLADLTEIGRVEDVALSPDGQMLGLTTDVGGFIGLGDKTVLIPLDDIRLVRPMEMGEISIVTRMDQDALTDLPEFDIDD